MTTVKIFESFIPALCEIKGDGFRPAGYMGYNAMGKGKLVATVSGPVELRQSGNSTMCKIEGLDQEYALRDILTLARKGQYGFSIV